VLSSAKAGAGAGGGAAHSSYRACPIRVALFQVQEKLGDVCKSCELRV
jgi:hypothetical protein